MNDNRRTYTVDLVGAADADSCVEILTAASDQEAIDLEELRLLLGPDYLTVIVREGNRTIVAFKRDSHWEAFRLIN